MQRLEVQHVVRKATKKRLDSARGKRKIKAMGRGKWSGQAFGTCWTCGGTHVARECPKGAAGGGGIKGGERSTAKANKVSTLARSWVPSGAVPDGSEGG